jgi:hypothetical protein
MAYKIMQSRVKKPAQVEVYDGDSGIQSVQEISDTAQTIRELNDDSVALDKFSAIDMKTRLKSIEISAIIAVDSLIALDFLPSDASFITRSKKRLAVSENGLGRSEVVQISQGMRDKEQGKSAFDRLGTFFGGNKQ